MDLSSIEAKIAANARYTLYLIVVLVVVVIALSYHMFVKKEKFGCSGMLDPAALGDAQGLRAASDPDLYGPAPDSSRLLHMSMGKLNDDALNNVASQYVTSA